MNKNLGVLLGSASFMAIVSVQLAGLAVFCGPALAGSTGAGGKGGDSVPGGAGGAGGTGSGGASGTVGSPGAGGGGAAAGGGTGGNGGNDGVPGGGAGGVPGGAGAAGAADGGGGGGGGGLNGQTGGGLAAATGIAGGAGGASTAVLHQPGGGGGGAGGFGIAGLTAGGSNTFTIVGGVGGAGGAGPRGGYGGAGGAGFSSATTLTVTNTGTITGGAGGAGGAGTILGGNGGDGGDAIAASNLILFNDGGTITGGAAGAASGGGTPGTAGTGGAAIAGANLTLTNAGTLAGGAGGSAVVFTGGTNSLMLQSGSIITGNVVAFSAADTFALGGAIDAAFDVSNIGPAAQYRGFGIFGKTGSSTWTLSGATAFSGSTIISGGTLALSGTASIVNSSVIDNATFDISGTTSGASIAGLTGSGLISLGGKTLTISNGAGTFSGTSSATGGGITISGGSTTFSNVLAYTGATAISGGTLNLTGAGSIAASSGLADAGAFDISGTTSGAALAALSGGGTVALGRQTLTLNAGNFSGAIGGNGNLVIAGGTTLSGVNSYNGTTTINAGTLALSGAGSIGTSASLTNLGTFDISQTTTGTSLKSLSGTGPVAMGSKTLTLTAAAGNYAGVFQDGGFGGGVGGGIAITGGTQILTGNSSYTGTTVIGSGATLQIGNNGPNGTLGSGAVTSNGTLAYFLSVPRTVGNVISGTGGLTQGGAGILTITAAQAYTGVTAINAGTTLALSGNGSLASSSAADAGVLDISGTTTGAAVASLSGAGSAALGSKILTIATGGASFSGVLSDGGINGGIGGGIAVNGGTEILSGANTYTGNTTIASGATVQVGIGSTAGALGSGGVTDSGTLLFNRSDTVTYGSVVSGNGGFTQSGAGNLILTGINTYTGNTNVNAGTLSVNGSIASSAVTVASGAKLGGSGTVGATSIASGGILAPGNSIGTIAVNGNLSLPAGSIYQVELSPTAADRTNVTGTATLGGALQLTPSTGAYASGTDYKLIAAGSVVSTFSSVTGAVPGLTNTVQYSATGVDLILGSPPTASTPAVTPGITPVVTPAVTSTVTPAIVTTFLFGTYGKVPNQIAAGNALAAGSSSGSLYGTVGNVVTTNAAAMPAALGQLAGDIHASIRSAAIEDSRLIRDTVLEHLGREANAVVVWGAGFGGYGSIATDGNASGMHHQSAGAIIGADAALDDALRVGVAAAYSSNNARTTDFASRANGSLGHVILYAGWSQDAVDLRLGGDYGWGGAQVTRNITSLAQSVTDHQFQQAAQLFADAGYKFAFDTATIEPHIGIVDIAAASGSFTEAGSTAAISGTGKTDNQAYSTLGLRASVDAMMLGDMAVTPRADIGWQHAFSRLIPGQTVAFQNTAQSFAVLGLPLGMDVATLQAGFDLAAGPRTTLFFGYDGSFSPAVQSNALRGGLEWKL